MSVAGGCGPPTNAGPELKPADGLGSDAMSGWLAGTRASESDRAPSKSISTADVAGAIPFDAAGAAIRYLTHQKRRMSLYHPVAYKWYVSKLKMKFTRIPE